jgi:AmiR/NasT family two-component response regulator
MAAGRGLWGLPALVHQATGMVMGQLSCSADEAVLRIIDLADQRQRSVLDVARDIVERRTRLPL